MRSEENAYSIGKDDSPGIYTLTRDDKPDQKSPANFDLTSEPAVIEKPPCR